MCDARETGRGVLYERKEKVKNQVGGYEGVIVACAQMRERRAASARITGVTALPAVTNTGKCLLWGCFNTLRKISRLAQTQIIFHL